MNFLSTTVYLLIATHYENSVTVEQAEATIITEQVFSLVCCVQGLKSATLLELFQNTGYVPCNPTTRIQSSVVLQAAARISLLSETAHISDSIWKPKLGTSDGCSMLCVLDLGWYFALLCRHFYGKGDKYACIVLFLGKGGQFAFY